ncbi:hypothetical protein GCM10010276_05350 [Streptomyces longisporus]|uniref:Secreted protein n=1 Tax=Streptomyces longisporus TaxID=1948 RepID=A0ABN3KZY0_STRLO
MVPSASRAWTGGALVMWSVIAVSSRFLSTSSVQRSGAVPQGLTGGDEGAGRPSAHFRSRRRGPYGPQGRTVRPSLAGRAAASLEGGRHMCGIRRADTGGAP